MDLLHPWRRSRLLKSALLPIAVGAFAACNEDSPPAVGPEVGDNIVDMAGTMSDISTLVTALEAANLVSTLETGGPFTVFAPVNSAFEALPAGELDRLLLPENRDELAQILTFHVVSGELSAAELSDGQTLTPLAGGTLTIEASGGGLSVNGANVVSPDNEAANGILHLIDQVMLPPELPTIAGVAAGNEDLSTLVAALTAVDLVGALEAEGPFTVFAPRNSAFAGLGDEVVAALLEEGNADLLAEILTFHVVPGAAALAGDLVDGQTLTTLQGEELTVGVSGAQVSINGIPVATADVAASNGVIHIIDGVLTPELDIVGTAIVTSATQTLVAAVAAGGLEETLQGEGPFTVFAPTNAAFEALGSFTLAELLDPANLSILQDVLPFHVVPGRVLAGDLTDGGIATTVECGELTVDLSDPQDPRVNGISITATDVMASNGVIHLIDEVLTQSINVVERALVTEETQTLAAAVNLAELDGALAGDGPFTVFAPIEAAFDAVGTDRLEVLLAPENRALLQKVLTYHVVAGDVRAADLQDGGTATTLEGSEVTFDLSGELPRVDGANIVATDIVVENGVIHLIDGVLTDNLDLVDVATLNGFSALVGAVAEAGLESTLRSDNHGAGFTVFAPTNQAFEALSALPMGDELVEILTYHVLPRTVGSGDLSDGLRPRTVQGTAFTVNIDGDTVTLMDGRGFMINVVLTDVPASNGVIHVIDGVLVPLSLAH